MHLDHDHDETVHSHTHTHADGTTHTHTHAHAHDHENEHTHSHEECEHTHCDACGGCEHSPKEELMALMKYMVGHNAPTPTNLRISQSSCRRWARRQPTTRSCWP